MITETQHTPIPELEGFASMLRFITRQYGAQLLFAMMRPRCADAAMQPLQTWYMLCRIRYPGRAAERSCLQGKIPCRSS